MIIYTCPHYFYAPQRQDGEMIYQTRQKLEVVTTGSWALISRQNSSQLEEGSWTVDVFLRLIDLAYEHSGTGECDVCWLSKESTVKDNNIAYAEHTNLMQLPSPAACCDLVYWRPRRPSLPDNSPTTTRWHHSWHVHHGIRYHSPVITLGGSPQCQWRTQHEICLRPLGLQTRTQGWAHHRTPFSSWLNRGEQRSTRVGTDREQWLRECLEGIPMPSRSYPKVVYKALRIGCSTSVYSLRSSIVFTLYSAQYHPPVFPYSRDHCSTLLHCVT